MTEEEGGGLRKKTAKEGPVKKVYLQQPNVEWGGVNIYAETQPEENSLGRRVSSWGTKRDYRHTICINCGERKARRIGRLGRCGYGKARSPGRGKKRYRISSGERRKSASSDTDRTAGRGSPDNQLWAKDSVHPLAVGKKTRV